MGCIQIFLCHLMLLGLCLNTGLAATCKTDAIEEYQCFPDAGWSLVFQAECSPGEIIDMDTVYYAISQSDECPEFDPNPYAFDSAPRCVIEELSSLLKRRCDNKASCEINLLKTSDTTTCKSYEGRHYLEVKYNCNPASGENADEPAIKTIEMCENIEWTGRYAEIVSDKNDKLTGSIPCNCELEKPQDAILTLSSTMFDISPQVAQPLCKKHRAVIQTDAYAVSYLCDKDGVDWTLGCGGTHKITFSYETRTVDVDVRFRVTAKVPKSSTMKIKCGIPNPNALTYPPTPPPTPAPITGGPSVPGPSPSGPGGPGPSPSGPGGPGPSPSGPGGETTEALPNGPVVEEAPSGLDTGAKVGISFAVIALIIIIVVIVAVVFLAKRRKSTAENKLVSNYSSGSSRTGSSADSHPSTDSSADSQPATISSSFDNKAYIQSLGEYGMVRDTMTGSLAADQAGEASRYGTMRSNYSITGTMDSTLRKKAGYYKSTGSIGSLRSNKSNTVASRASGSRVSLHSVVLEEDATLVLNRKNNSLFQRFEDSNC